MISICIPIYNFDATSLVQELESQLVQVDPPVEIVLMDDGSDEMFQKVNRQLASDVTAYHQLPENIGRAAIRNQLVQTARYEYLLFLDCDSEMERSDFIQKYVANAGEAVICGGTTYSSHELEAGQLLHFTYGKVREAKGVEMRNEAPYRSFKTNNFMAPRKVMQAVPFAEQLTTYGHEDTLFSIALREKGIPIRHIDNPVIHGQLEANGEFLRKSKMAVQNLYLIYQQRFTERFLLADEVLLVKWFRWLQKLRLVSIAYYVLKIFKDGWEAQLQQFTGSGLWRFSAWKLYCLLELHRKCK